MTHEVWVDDRHIGDFRIEKRPNFQVPALSFAYRNDWLADAASFAISPDLPLQRGPHTPAPHRQTFTAFDDAAPDRWGRDLLDAGMQRGAKSKGERFSPFSEIALLLAVSDDTRQGALRFRKNGEFLGASDARAGIRDLAKLAASAKKFAETGDVDQGVEELIGVGSSPGGAQPKAWVRDDSGRMHLAKFPRTSDIHDVSAWESATITLQAKAGIIVQSAATLPLSAEQSVFLTERFDRDGSRRIPYMSFRTAFGIGETDSIDYATLAARLASISARPGIDASELFSRAAFSALSNNIDDHMRNHGLLRGKAGWRLAPAFDVNPSRAASGATRLTPEDDPYDRDVRLLVEHADAFRLTRTAAIKRLRTVNEAVAGWRKAARKAGVMPDAVDYLEKAFEGENRDRVASLSTSSPVVIDLAAVGDVWVSPHMRDGQKVEGHFRRRRS